MITNKVNIIVAKIPNFSIGLLLYLGETIIEICWKISICRKVSIKTGFQLSIKLVPIKDQIEKLEKNYSPYPLSPHSHC